MATLRTTLPDLYLSLLANLEEVLWEEYEIEPMVSQRVMKVRDMGDRPFVNVTGVASFGVVPKKNEGENVVYDDLAQGYDKKFTADSYELGFKTTKEAIDDEQFEIVADAGRALGNSARYSVEVTAANVFNNGFTSTTGSPDGVALFATNHPLIGGGTEQNELTTSDDLDVVSIRTALNDIADTTDDAGKLIHWRPKILLVPAELKWLAQELIQSPDRPDTADRAINAFRDEGLTVVTWPYLTDADAFFLLANPDRHNIRFYWRERPNTMHDFDFDASAMKIKVRYRMVTSWADFRGGYGSPGA